MRQMLERLEIEGADELAEIPSDTEVCGEFTARFHFRNWHTIAFTFEIDPQAGPRCLCIAVHAGHERVTAADLRSISLPTLFAQAVAALPVTVPTVDQSRTRQDVTRELLEHVAGIYRDAGNRADAVRAVMQQLHKSRAQAYRLVGRAIDAGYATEHQGGSS